MPTYNFVLDLNREVSCTGEDEELQLMNAFADITPAITSGPGGTRLEFDDFEADSLADVVLAMAARVHAVSPTLWAARLSHDDDVTLTEAAERTKGARTRESLRLLAEGKRGPGGFPAPRYTSRVSNHRIYSWAAISTYLREVMGDDLPEVDPEMAWLDQLLAARSALHAAGADDAVWTRALAA